MEIKNAVVTSTYLGIEDHGIMTCYLYLDYGGSGQGFGGYGFDSPVKESGKFKGRVGTAFGCEFIRRVLTVLGVDKWENLPGTHLRVKAEQIKIHEIGHILKDNWFSPEALAREMVIGGAE